MILSAIIYFIVCHGGPADHFATFSKNLQSQGCEVHIMASGVAVDKLEERQVPIEKKFSLQGLSLNDQEQLASQISESLKEATTLVITDIAHPFDILLQKKISENRPSIKRAAYYDNPEAYVPGGYSEIADLVIAETQKVFFSNIHFEQDNIYKSPQQVIDLAKSQRVGIGYFPLENAELMAQERKKDKSNLRSKFFNQIQIPDCEQKIYAYYGGNNEAYFHHALPTFLKFLTEGLKDFTDFIIIYKQHPGAQLKNEDLKKIADWQQENGPLPLWIVQDVSLNLPSLVDGVLYHQTSLAYQFYLSGCPLMQVGDPYEDILVKNKLCLMASDVISFVNGLKILHEYQPTEEGRHKMLHSLGYDQQWKERLFRGTCSN